jgi:hypothetical protein
MVAGGPPQGDGDGEEGARAPVFRLGVGNTTPAPSSAPAGKRVNQGVMWYSWIIRRRNESRMQALRHRVQHDFSS